MSEVTINAEGLQKAATQLRTTLFEMQKTVEKFDSVATALMQYLESFIDRFEAATKKLEEKNGISGERRSEGVGAPSAPQARDPSSVRANADARSEKDSQEYRI